MMGACTGGIGDSYTLTATCSPSTAGQLTYLPSVYSLTPLALPLSVAQCGQGTEQVRSASCSIPNLMADAPSSHIAPEIIASVAVACRLYLSCGGRGESVQGSGWKQPD